MRESLKSVLALIIAAALLIAAVAWFEDRPGTTTWVLRFACPAALALSGIFMFLLMRKKDIEVDYLAQLCGNYFNRDGLCFVISSVIEDGVCWFEAVYQSQYTGPLLGMISIRPERGIFGGHANIEQINFRVSCPPGGLGRIRIPVPIGQDLQGKSVKFEVGAGVKYPEGKGDRIRFKDGIFIRTNTSFDSGLKTALVIAGAMGGALVLATPATVTVPIPVGDISDQVDEIPIEEELLWQIGQPSLSA